MPDYKQKFENGEYPGCFLPYPPFYGMCINGIKYINKVVQNDEENYTRRKCIRCIRQLELCGHERLGYSEDAENPSDSLDNLFERNSYHRAFTRPTREWRPD